MTDAFDLSPETLRTETTALRALARAMLHHGGDRRAWIAPLVVGRESTIGTATNAGVAALWSGAIFMTLQTKLILGALCVAAIAAGAWALLPDSTDPASSLIRTGEPPAVASGHADQPQVEAQEAVLPVTSREELVAARAETPEAADSDDLDLVEPYAIDVVAIDDKGWPIADAKVTVWRAKVYSPGSYDGTSKTADIITTTNTSSSGRCTLELEHGMVWVQAKHPDLGESWS